jgi:hypothetical protein
MPAIAQISAFLCRNLIQTKNEHIDYIAAVYARLEISLVKIQVRNE